MKETPPPTAVKGSGERGAERAAEFDSFYDRLGPSNLSPLWEVLKELLPAQPKSRAAPCRWRYRDVRPLLIESGRLLSAEEAERRVLVLENPALPGETRATNTLYAGIQLIMPGEVAPAHRHTQSALRFFIEGEGASTSVDGERAVMKPGDFVITPPWTFHDHANEGGEPCIWLDGLDLPIVGFFEAGFSEHRDAPIAPGNVMQDHSSARFGQGLLPIGGANPRGLTSPVLNYPYSRTREALLTMARDEIDPNFGAALRYANPFDGGWAMPTIASWIFHLPRGFQTAPVRSTDGIVMAIVEGAGQAIVGAEAFSFEPKDTIAVPGWTWRSLKADEDCVVFAFSDRAAQEKLGFFKQELQS